MKKYIIISALLFTAYAVQSCSDNGYDLPYDDYASFTWWSSPKTTYNTTTKTAKLNKFMAFQDVSKGDLSHEWIISQGTAFMKPGFSENDSLNYAKFIIPDAGLVTNEKLAYVLFQEAGVKTIKIKNTYKDSIRGTKKVDGVWTAEQTITVTVSTPVIP
ncbi:hypothetical protein SLW70_15940 [Flavobacterium sp. NG2]|uniref:hypothetical protein n=1 Tax=Flavobacterium sp. NG2 TaxID=3097547 RepID=UPI002A8393D4|nr:hypothetical protein [Flavobacterium sp. NG2]WPR71406.1 hypothetical protein SLW70_15940 [Flavobacterium sp. NG2]